MNKRQTITLTKSEYWKLLHQLENISKSGYYPDTKDLADHLYKNSQVRRHNLMNPEEKDKYEIKYTPETFKCMYTALQEIAPLCTNTTLKDANKKLKKTYQNLNNDYISCMQKQSVLLEENSRLRAALQDIGKILFEDPQKNMELIQKIGNQYLFMNGSYMEFNKNIKDDYARKEEQALSDLNEIYHYLKESMEESDTPLEDDDDFEILMEDIKREDIAG